MSTENHLNNKQLENLAILLSKITSNQKSITIERFEDEYIGFVRSNHSIAYRISVDVTFKHLTKYFSKEMILDTITQREVERFIDAIKKHAPEGYRVYYRNLKAAFNKAMDWGYIYDNPFKKIKLPKRQLNKPEFITEEELNKILKHIELKAFKIGCPIKKKVSLLIIADVVKTAYLTGMRLGEVNNLRWENVKLEQKYLIVGDNKFTTKGRKQRIMPIAEKLNEMLSTRKLKCANKNDFVFSVNGQKAFSNDYISKTFKNICREVGIDEIIRFHSLRHSFASNLAQKGVSPFQLKELLGHSSLAVTEKYSHLNIESLREAINKFN
ncbi:MAG TPA: tyrosine-type recombinase/integrase [Ignavibacteriaceae bacterium]|nr:tyrosine-type recombinase/integrase [Ignavibacteriaceae bacterium]